MHEEGGRGKLGGSKRIKLILTSYGMERVVLPSLMFTLEMFMATKGDDLLSVQDYAGYEMGCRHEINIKITI